MKLEDENFEEEFMKWLNSKTVKELLDSLKRYVYPKKEGKREIKYSVKYGMKYDYSKIKYSKEFIEIVCQIPRNMVF